MNIVEITPPNRLCGVGACPAVFKTDRGTYLLIGRDISNELPKALQGRVGANETVIEMPGELLVNVNTVAP